ncbi:MAG: hypothetical protein JOY93_06725 [Acidobacteriales bacterium]|nr:hypothetical protein [Terriglobales bacterium]
MSRKSTWFLLPWLLVTAAFAQKEIPPAGKIKRSQLVAWSEMQAAEPVGQSKPGGMPTPDPKPETQPQPNSPSSNPAPPARPQAPDADTQNKNEVPAAQTFTGTIRKEGDTFVLKVSDTTSYKLDDQDKAKQFDGQRVRVTGSLETKLNLLHVQKIESLS